MESPQVWLVVEYHCDLPEPDQVSIWISGRPLSDDRELADDVAEKLMGPVPLAESERLVGVLRDQLQAAGITVFVDWAADD
jgi:hypothetical protein